MRDNNNNYNYYYYYYYYDNDNVNDRNLAMDIPRGGSSCSRPPFPGLMTFAMLVFVEEENWMTRRKTLGATKRTKNKLRPHVVSQG